MSSFFRYFFTSGMGYSLKWNMLAASAASARPLRSQPAAPLPAPPEAITGIETFLLIVLVRSKS